jgi:hypothetical protein
VGKIASDKMVYARFDLGQFANLCCGVWTWWVCYAAANLVCVYVYLSIDVSNACTSVHAIPWYAQAAHI